MIEWHKVTWYSKLAAVIFFLGLFPIWTFYLGTQYERTISEINYYSAITPIYSFPSTHTAPTVTPATGTTTPITKIDSGIKGKVTIGPTCPVEQNPPVPGCADRPYAAKLVAIKRITAEQTVFQVASDGTFQVSLPPGDYSIRNTSTAILPRMQDQEITVYPHQYTNLNIQFDSGIR